MATVAEKTYTPDDLLAITDRPPPELVDGKLVERESMGQESSAIALTIGSLLLAYSRANLPGAVSGADGGYQIFPHEPNRIRFPDVAFTRKDRLPGGQPARGHATVAPDLAVEVVSPNDNAADLLVKMDDYLKAGVPMVWVVNPDGRSVQVIRGDGTRHFLRESDTLDGGDVLPGFRCRVAEFFE
jgi:Uma2 family endonuclease